MVIFGQKKTLQLLIRGIDFVDVQFGISTIKFMSQGEAVCGIKDVDDSKVIKHMIFSSICCIIIF